MKDVLESLLRTSVRLSERLYNGEGPSEQHICDGNTSTPLSGTGDGVLCINISVHGQHPRPGRLVVLLPLVSSVMAKTSPWCLLDPLPFLYRLSLRK